MRKLVEDSVIRNAFLLADVSTMRQWWLLKAEATNKEITVGECMECDRAMNDSKRCSKTFATLKALLLHQKKLGGTRARPPIPSF